MPAGEVITYSIVGRCARTGELGGAVASAVPAVGAICVYLRPGMGAVSTQSWVNPYLAGAILDRLAAGEDAAAALDAAITGESATDGPGVTPDPGARFTRSGISAPFPGSRPSRPR